MNKYIKLWVVFIVENVANLNVIVLVVLAALWTRRRVTIAHSFKCFAIGEVYRKGNVAVR